MMLMSRVSPSPSAKRLGNMSIDKFPVSTMSASQKRELKNKSDIQISKVRSALRCVEEVESKERISSLKNCSKGAKLGNKSGNNNLSSSVQRCEKSTSATGSVVVSCAGKRERSLGLLNDDQEVVKKQRMNESTVMEKSVVKHADKVPKSGFRAATTTSCKGKRVSMNRNEYHEAFLGTPCKQNLFLANNDEDQQIMRKKLLEMKQRDEGIAKFKAAAATWKKLMMEEREREREAARLALEQMEKTVEIYESQEIIQEIEMLANRGYTMVNPLKMLGLFLKSDECAEEED